jgi:hypothetical protein
MNLENNVKTIKFIYLGIPGRIELSRASPPFVAWGGMYAQASACKGGLSKAIDAAIALGCKVVA